MLTDDAVKSTSLILPARFYKNMLQEIEKILLLRGRGGKLLSKGNYIRQQTTIFIEI
jgi:hypothetical protein